MNQRTMIAIALMIIFAIGIGSYLIQLQDLNQSTLSDESPEPTSTPEPPQTSSPSPPQLSPPKGASEESLTLHTSLWKNTTAKALINRTYAYAIYASRIIGVKHPDVYLQADSLFLKEITSNDGYQKAYLIKDVTDTYFQVDDPLSGPPFSFNDVELQNYSLVDLTDLYFEQCPLLGYLDRRMAPIACTLKTTENTLTELELAEQYYFKIKLNQSTENRLFIVYCDNENTYLFHDEQLISMKTLTNTDALDGNPILIFDEEGVWYPLMERDDTESDPVLKEAVDNVKTATVAPILSNEEGVIISCLRNTTLLNNDRQLAIARLSAAHTQMVGIGPATYPVFRAEWENAKIPFSGGMGLFMEIMRVANYLSPITAQLATHSNETDGAARMTAITHEYTKYTATKFYTAGNLSWGYTWPCGLYGNNIDETYRTKGSHCVWQAINLASVIDAMGLDSYLLNLYYSEEGIIKTSEWHSTVYIPDYDLVLGNGVVETLMYKRPDTVVNYVKKDVPRTAIRYLSHGGRWAVPLISSNPSSRYYHGSMPPGVLAEELTYLTVIHGDKIEGYVIQPERSYTITFQELIDELHRLQVNYKPMILP